MYSKWDEYTEEEREELIAIYSRLENEFFSGVDNSWEASALRAAEIIALAQQRNKSAQKGE